MGGADDFASHLERGSRGFRLVRPGLDAVPHSVSPTDLTGDDFVAVDDILIRRSAFGVTCQ